jgi:hypothetical protein
MWDPNAFGEHASSLSKSGSSPQTAVTPPSDRLLLHLLISTSLKHKISTIMPARRSLLMRRLSKRQHHQPTLCNKSLRSPTPVRGFASQQEGHLVAIYREMAQTADIQVDTHQLRALNELDRLYRELETYKTPKTTIQEDEPKSWWSSFASQTSFGAAPPPPVAPKGVVSPRRCGMWKNFLHEALLQHLTKRRQTTSALS